MEVIKILWNRSKSIAIIFASSGLLITIIGLIFSLETIEEARQIITLVLLRAWLPILFLRNFYELVYIYLFALGYLCVFFSFSTVLHGLKMKISNNWRYISFILSNVYGFLLFFLSLTVYIPSQPTFFDYLPIIMSIIFIATGPLILILGLKEEWDEAWKAMSINASQIIGILVIVLGFIMFENSFSKWVIFTTSTTPDTQIALFLIISGILVNLSITFIIAIDYGIKLKDKRLSLLALSIFCSDFFLIMGIASFVLEYIAISAFDLTHSSLGAMYLILSVFFSGASILFMTLLRAEVFQVAYHIKRLKEDDPIHKLSEITRYEIEALNNIDIFTILDLSNEDDLEEISKITKIQLDRIKLLKEIADESLLKKKMPENF